MEVSHLPIDLPRAGRRHRGRLLTLTESVEVRCGWVAGLDDLKTSYNMLQPMFHGYFPWLYLSFTRGQRDHFGLDQTADKITPNSGDLANFPQHPRKNAGLGINYGKLPGQNNHSSYLFISIFHQFLYAKNTTHFEVWFWSS